MLNTNKILILGMIFVAIFLISLNTVASAGCPCTEESCAKDLCKVGEVSNCWATNCVWENTWYIAQGFCHCPNNCDINLCNTYCTTKGYGVGECLAKGTVRSCNKTLSGNDAEKDCICYNYYKYFQTGTYITPRITSTKTVGLISINMSIQTPIPGGTIIKVTGYVNSTDGTTWNTWQTVSGPDNSNFTLPSIFYGKYFNVSFSLASNQGQTNTPNLMSLTLVTTPRLTNVVQGPTVAKCGQIPEGMIYTCTSPFTTAYQNGSNQASGSIVNCDNLGNNLTTLNTRLNSTEYRENNYNDNFAAYVNNSKCSLP
jgi:hypothetical protein